MRKYIQFFVVLLLAVSVVGVAGNRPAWAGSFFGIGQPSGAAVPSAEITITETGSYYVGGLCQFNVLYTGSGASSTAAVDVPADESRKVPHDFEDDLYLAGCHIVHYTLESATGQKQVTREMSPTYGSWEVCFGDRPDVELTIFYYLDDPENGEPIWQPLVTTYKDGLSCAPAMYSGVYAPGGKPLVLLPVTGEEVEGGEQVVLSPGGTVRPPAPVETGRITESGTYNGGGVCSLVVEYFEPGLSTELRVEESIDVSANVPYPDNSGLLYLPGCHVYHYESDDLVTDVTEQQGNWKICFAAIPDKENTIYFYYAEDETPEGVKSAWTPLETTYEGGMACAPLTTRTGVYTPTGK